MPPGISSTPSWAMTSTPATGAGARPERDLLGTDLSEAFIGCSAVKSQKAHRLTRRAPAVRRGWAVSIDRLRGRYTTCSSADPFGRVAGVGTFPDGLSLAVAPASKGLFPQPVSMSGAQSRVTHL